MAFTMKSAVPIFLVVCLVMQLVLSSSSAGYDNTGSAAYSDSDNGSTSKSTAVTKKTGSDNAQKGVVNVAVPLGSGNKNSDTPIVSGNESNNDEEK